MMARLTLPVPFSDYPLPAGRGGAASLAGVRVGYERTFDTRVGRASERVRDVAEAFGLGLEAKPYTIYSRFELELEPGHVVYITGESGGGKSLLMRFLAEELSKHREFSPVVTSWRLAERVDRRVRVIDSLGRDTAEAISILSAAGLSDTYSWLRRFDELSEGQKLRYLFALALSKGARTLVLDEFCSTLDRETARAAAYTFQRYVRRRGMTLIAGTAMNDLEEDLNPDIVIVKHLGSGVEVRRRDVVEKPCSLLRSLRVEEGCYDDWRRLAFLHYRSHHAGGVKKVFKACIDDRLIGVVVYAAPYFPAGGHASCFNAEWYRRHRGEHVLRIERVVVHPSFRGIGVSRALLLESMERLDKPFVEILSVMQRFHNFTKSYMVSFEVPLDARKLKALRSFEERFGVKLHAGVDALARRFRDGRSLNALRRWVAENYGRLLDPRIGLDSQAIMRMRREKLFTLLKKMRVAATPKVYGLWINPDKKWRALQLRALKREFVEKYARWLLSS